MSNTIHLKGFGRHEEAVASGILSPGHLLTLDADSKVKVHATEGGYAERAFATEDALQGKTVKDAYAVGDIVPYALAVPGDEVQARLKAGENVGVDDFLISAGDGTLIALGSAASATTVRQIVAVAVVAKDLSASGAVASLIKVRVV